MNYDNQVSLTDLSHSEIRVLKRLISDECKRVRVKTGEERIFYGPVAKKALKTLKAKFC